MRFFHSLRWRLQLWHAAFLVLALGGFLVTDYRLQWADIRRRVSLDLRDRAGNILSSLEQGAPQDGRGRGRRGDRFPPPPEDLPDGGPPGRPSDGMGPTHEPGLDFRGGFGPPPPPLALMESVRRQGGEGRYAVLWRRDGRELARSDGAGQDLQRPATRSTPEWVEESNGHMRAVRITPRGEMAMVALDLAGEQAALQRHMMKLTLGGCGVLVLGLLGGGFMAARALAPIQSISAAARRISKGDLSQRVATAEQFSELGELAAVLNDTFEKLEQVFTQQARFTSDAAHELRTPISVLLAQTQSALMRERSPVEYRETLESCQRAARRMHQLIESLLALARFDARQDPGHRVPTNLATVAQDAVQSLRPLADERAITIETPLEDAFTRADPVHLTQILNNLIANAIFYNREGGRIAVSTRQEGPHSCISVEDSGRGIPESEIAHLFTRFHRVDRARNRGDGGTGLGLAITKSIVDSYQGVIEVQSEVGKGTWFTVKLPACRRLAPT